MSTRRKPRNRPGLTLIEMLVALILLAILVAVIFPVVTQQIDDADPAKAANDLTNLKTGLEVFQLNVRPAYPSDLEDLANPITTDDEFLTRAGVDLYGTGQTTRWNGPYIDKALPLVAGTAFGDAFVTGYGGVIQNDLIQYDAQNDCPLGGTNCTTAYDGDNQVFVAIMITGLGEDQAQRISRLIDGDTDLLTGNFRYHDEADTGTFVAYYLAAPLRSQ